MNSIHLLLSLCSLSFLTTTLAASPLFTICSKSSGNFSDRAYAKSVQKLTKSLVQTVPSSGFDVAFSGKIHNKAYGLALCRGDVSAEPCKICVADAAVQLPQACPTQNEAIIWFDNCLLHYSSVNFFGSIDNANKFYMWNTQVVPKPMPFNKNVKELLTTVSAKAHGQRSFFGTGEMEIGEMGKLYALAQCTRDLSAADCRSCLETAIGELPNCCDGKRGGRVVGGSCNFRYELYPFYGNMKP